MVSGARLFEEVILPLVILGLVVAGCIHYLRATSAQVPPVPAPIAVVGGR